MATYNEIIEGLKICAAHDDRGLDSTFGDVDHDIIYAGGVGEYMRPVEASADGERLRALGWHIDLECACWALFT